MLSAGLPTPHSSQTIKPKTGIGYMTVGNYNLFMQYATKSVFSLLQSYFRGLVHFVTKSIKTYTLSTYLRILIKIHYYG